MAVDSGGKKAYSKIGSINGMSWMFTDHELAKQYSRSTSLRVAESGGSRLAELRFKGWGATRYTYGSMLTKRQFTGQRNETADIGLYFYNVRWYDPALGRWVQPDTDVPESQGDQRWDRFAYANNNPLYYTDPTGHMAIGDTNSEAGCTTPGSPKCILDKYYGVSTDNEWMMDMELYYYQQAYPEYDVNSDPYLDNIGKLSVTAPTLRADCAGGSFWSCFAMAVMGGIGTTIAQPVIIRSAESAPQKYGNDPADPDCPGCGFRLNSPNLDDILMPGGTPVGTQQGRDPRIRTVQSEQELMAIFNALKTDATPYTGMPTYPGEVYQLNNSGLVGLRSSRDHGLTVNIWNMPTIPIDKIHLPMR